VLLQVRVLPGPPSLASEYPTIAHQRGRFADTNKLFTTPAHVDIHFTQDGSPRFWAEKIAGSLRPSFNPQAPTALFVGRYQPFHQGHLTLIEAGIDRVGQCCIAVRDTHGLDACNPMSFFEIKRRIDAALHAHVGKYSIVAIPNITHVFYGRDVGYVIEEIDLDAATKKISATAIRDEMKG
jgi:adenylylsulfate kinase